MHCLETIVARNERAAAREEAHAYSDKRFALKDRICLNNDGDIGHSPDYEAAYESAKKEG